MLNDKPEVSVIIPCYNYGKYIDDAVNSVLTQTYQNFEIIIVNDGSTDKKTNEILSNYNRPKTRVIHIANQGPAVARNTAIKEAKGRYILPLDADDKIDKTYIEKAVNILDLYDNVGIVSCNIKYFGKPKIHIHKFPEYQFPDILIFNSFVNSCFFRKSDWEAAGGYNENMKKGWEDHDFWLSIIGLQREVYKIPEYLFYYRTHFKFLSRHNSLTNIDREQLYINMYNNHKEMYIDNVEILLKYIVKLREIINKRNKILKYLTYTICITLIACYFCLSSP